jgi:hypothetical protein
LWKEIAKDLTLDYKLQPMDFSGILPALQTRNVDVALAGITIKDKRKKVIDFPDGYYDSGFTLMVPADSAIKGPVDLKGKTLAVKTGTSSIDYAKANFKNTDLRAFPNIGNAYLELATGRVDAAMHDTPNVLYYVHTAGRSRVKAVGTRFTNLQSKDYIAFLHIQTIIAFMSNHVKRDGKASLAFVIVTQRAKSRRYRDGSRRMSSNANAPARSPVPPSSRCTRAHLLFLAGIDAIWDSPTALRFHVPDKRPQLVPITPHDCDDIAFFRKALCDGAARSIARADHQCHLLAHGAALLMPNLFVAPLVHFRANIAAMPCPPTMHSVTRP